MDRSRTSQRRVQIQASGKDREEETRARFQPPTEDQEPFMGVKARRITSLHRDYNGDYLDVPSYPFLLKLLHKQGTPPLSLSLPRSRFQTLQSMTPFGFLFDTMLRSESVGAVWYYCLFQVFLGLFGCPVLI